MKRAIEQTMRRWDQRGSRFNCRGGWAALRCADRGDRRAGSVPLSTLRAKIDYGFAEAKTAQGHIGIKVWVNQGDYLKMESRPMALMPKRVKFRKSQKGRVRGNATRGNYVAFGEYGLQALEPGRIDRQTIEAGRVVASQMVKGGGKVYIRVFPRRV